MPNPPGEAPLALTGAHRFALLMACGLTGCAIVIVYLSLSGPAPISGQQAAAAAAAQRSALSAIEINGKSAYVLDLRTGETMYERNGEAQLPLASITKVALALAVSEVLSPESVIEIPFDTEFSAGGERLLTGERWRVKEIINYTLVASSNGGARILAQAADRALREKYPEAPEGAAALYRMNALAREIGLSQTYFLNVSGLDESATQSGAYGSAKDVAHLMAYAASTSPEVFAGTARDGLLLTGETGESAEALNTNEALGDIQGLIMGKTGYTELAGGNLAVIFDVGLAHPVAVVVLGSTRAGRFSDVTRLIAAAREHVANQ